eukprot:SAG31_NODE_3190_length_4571_cov_3.184481_4_plen_261_part_00
MLFGMPKGIGGRHPEGIPSHAVDGHTRRGSGMDTSAALLPAARRWGLAGEVVNWPAEEIDRSHGPGRQWAASEAEVCEDLPYTKGGYFRKHGGWLRWVSLPSNIVRTGGDRDAEDCDPYAPHSVYRLLHAYGFDESFHDSMPYDTAEVKDMLAQLADAKSTRRALAIPPPMIASASAFPELVGESVSSNSRGRGRGRGRGQGNRHGHGPSARTLVGGSPCGDDVGGQGTHGEEEEEEEKRKNKEKKKKTRRSRIQGAGWS